MSFQLHKSFVRLRNTIKDILDKTQEACNCPVDCQVNKTVEVQKSMKSLARVLHLPSVVQSEFYEATIIFLYAKKIKMTFFQQFVSSLSRLVSVEPFWILPTILTTYLLLLFSFHMEDHTPKNCDIYSQVQRIWGQAHGTRHWELRYY